MKTPKYPVVLLDFDGTLVNTGPGIVKSLTHAAKETGVELPLHETWRFIGPPLVAFTASMGFDEELSTRLISTFRAHYNTEGWKSSEPYEGMRELLTDLIKFGAKVYVCTSKPERIASMMMDYYALPCHGVCGADEALGRFDKADVIRVAAERYGFPLDSTTVMVGDAPRDITAGKECGLSTISLGYGYGLAHELAEAAADQSANSVSELRELLL
ncbi:MAG: HAD hydrolase-like protein [Christensenellales bacterium]|jgi:phosphoglycolate phosphatase